MTMQRITRSRGGTAAGAAPARADPSAVGSEDGNFHVIDEISADGPAGNQSTVGQDTMSVLPTHLLDSEIVRLRSSLTALRKSLDDVVSEIEEQVEVVKQAKGRNVPRPVMIQYTKVLESLLIDGDRKLNSFSEGTDSLLQRLEMLILSLETTNPEEHKKVVIVRNNLVGNARPYKGIFRKMRVQHEELLSVLTEEENSAVASSVAAPPVVSHSRN